MSLTYVDLFTVIFWEAFLLLLLFLFIAFYVGGSKGMTVFYMPSSFKLVVTELKWVVKEL